MKRAAPRPVTTIAIAIALLCTGAARANAAASDRIVTDEVGREVKIPAEVNRIVTLAPNLTEIVYALGLGDKLAGDTTECDNPPAAMSKPHVGEPQNPSIEAIFALHPDLVLATTSINNIDTADELKRLGIAVYTSNGEFETVLKMLDSIDRMADLMGAKPRGDELVANLHHRLDVLHARLEDRPMVHVLFVIWLDPLMTIGQDIFIADALRWAGAESVVLSKQNWPRINIEEVVRLQPDYIIFTAAHGESPATEIAELRSRPVWRDLDAVEQGHVLNMSEESIRPAPGLIDEIEKLAREVHPEAVSANNRQDSMGTIQLAQKFIAECEPCAR